MNGLLCVVYNVHVAKRWDPLCQLSRVWSDTTLALSCPELPFTCSSRKLKNKYSMACLQQATNAFGNLKIETLKQKFMNWKVHVLYARFFFISIYDNAKMNTSVAFNIFYLVFAWPPLLWPCNIVDNTCMVLCKCFHLVLILSCLLKSIRFRFIL